MFEYAVTIRTKSRSTYNLKVRKAEDSVPKVHDLMEHHILQRDFLWTDEEFMLRTSEIEAFHVKRLPTLQEKHDEAEEVVLAYIKREYPYQNIDVEQLVNIYRHKPEREMNREIPVYKCVLDLQHYLKPISEYLYQEENKND